MVWPLSCVSVARMVPGLYSTGIGIQQLEGHTQEIGCMIDYRYRLYCLRVEAMLSKSLEHRQGILLLLLHIAKFLNIKNRIDGLFYKSMIRWRTVSFKEIISHTFFFMPLELCL
jgi:hypothetical protein